MLPPDPVQLAQELIRFDTVNPPGFERDCAAYLGRILEAAGFETSYEDFDEGRTTLIARLAGSDSGLSPLAITGHLDTVPFGHQPWTREPLAGEISDGRLYGRGASDMKSGVAVAVTSAVAAAKRRPKRGLLLVLTAGEETGCDGSRYVAGVPDLLGEASGLLVAEPTSNYPAIGHRGALWVRAQSAGKTAYGSMPERGVNAIYRAAKAISKLEDFGFNEKPDSLLGSPSINVGTVQGGMNVNSVPDFAEFTVDIRSISENAHDRTLEQISSYLGEDVSLQAFVDLKPVKSAPDDPFVACAYRVVEKELGLTPEPRTLPFFTDASILAEAMAASTVIIGPGETSLAHQTDEYCVVDRIPECEVIYRRLIEAWCNPS